MVMGPAGLVAAAGTATVALEVLSVISRIVTRLAARVPDKLIEIFPRGVQQAGFKLQLLRIDLRQRMEKTCSDQIFFGVQIYSDMDRHHASPTWSFASRAITHG